MLKLKFLNRSDERIAEFLRTRSARIAEEFGAGIMRAMIRLASYIGAEKLSGQVLKARTGNLRSAVLTGVQSYRSGTASHGRIPSGGLPWYGALQEDGGSFTAHRNLKKPAHLMRRAMGERVMTGSPYGIYFPARPFMRPSLQEQRGMIIEELVKSMHKALAED